MSCNCNHRKPLFTQTPSFVPNQGCNKPVPRQNGPWEYTPSHIYPDHHVPCGCHGMFPPPFVPNQPCPMPPPPMNDCPTMVTYPVDPRCVLQQPDESCDRKPGIIEYTAGDGITIDKNNTISVKQSAIPTYTAGDGINIDDDNVISVDQSAIPTYTAGDGINIDDDNVISVNQSALHNYTAGDGINISEDDVISVDAEKISPYSEGECIKIGEDKSISVDTELVQRAIKYTPELKFADLYRAAENGWKLVLSNDTRNYFDLSITEDGNKIILQTFQYGLTTQILATPQTNEDDSLVNMTILANNINPYVFISREKLNLAIFDFYNSLDIKIITTNNFLVNSVYEDDGKTFAKLSKDDDGIITEITMALPNTSYETLRYKKRLTITTYAKPGEIDELRFIGDSFNYTVYDNVRGIVLDKSIEKFFDMASENQLSVTLRTGLLYINQPELHLDGYISPKLLFSTIDNGVLYTADIEMVITDEGVKGRITHHHEINLQGTTQVIQEYPLYNENSAIFNLTENVMDNIHILNLQENTSDITANLSNTIACTLQYNIPYTENFAGITVNGSNGNPIQINNIDDLEQLPTDIMQIGILNNCGYAAEFEHIPNHTLRILFEDSNVDASTIENGGTWKKISQTQNKWDWQCDDTDWSNKFRDIEDIFEVVGSGDISHVTCTDSMFEECMGVTSIKMLGMSGLQSAESMFDSCYRLANINITGITNLTNAAKMFKRCYALTNIPLVDTSKATNVESIFEECELVENIPAIDTSSATSIRRIMCGCSAAKYIPDFNIDNVSDATSAFEGCWNAESGIIEMYNKIKNNNGITEYIGCFSLAGRYSETASDVIESISYKYGGYQDIQPNTLLIRFDKEDYNPITMYTPQSDEPIEWTKNDSSEYNEWFMHCDSNRWDYIIEYLGFLYYDTDDQETMTEPYSIVAAGDTSSVISLGEAFANWAAEYGELCGLKSTVLFDTKNVSIDMYDLFADNNYLTTIPKFYTPNVTDCSDFVEWCCGLTELPHLVFPSSQFFTWYADDDINLRKVAPMEITTQVLPYEDWGRYINFRSAFYHCMNIKHMPIITIDTPLDIRFDYAFINTINIDTDITYLYNELRKHQVDNSDCYELAFANCGAKSDRTQKSLDGISSVYGGHIIETGALILRFENPEYNPLKQDPMLFQFIVKPVSGSEFNDWYLISNNSNEVFDYTIYTSLTEPFSIVGTYNSDKISGICSLVYKIDDEPYLRALKSVSLGDLPQLSKLYNAFRYCNELTDVSIASSPNLNNIEQAFYDCTKLKQIPDLQFTNTSLNVYQAFANCRNVEDGILELYNNISSRATYYTACFYNCGIDSETGAEQLAQIPDMWK